MNPRLISNSEVGAYNLCDTNYFWAFYLKREPKKLSDPLDRGNLGHNALEHYMKARIDSATHEEALEVQQDYLTNMTQVASQRGNLAVVLEVTHILARLHSYFNGFPDWQILGAENKVVLPINEDFSMPIKYDLYIKDVTTKKYKIVDYKFTYDFWSPLAHNINVQFPKYQAVMQANNYQVDSCELFEIRTRPLGREKAADPKYTWRLTPYFPSLPNKKNALRHQINGSKKVMKFRNQLDEVTGGPDNALQALREGKLDNVLNPIYNKFVCDKCSFIQLCSSRIDGGDINFLLGQEFTDNSYDYNPTQEGTLV